MKLIKSKSLQLLILCLILLLVFIRQKDLYYLPHVSENLSLSQEQDLEHVKQIFPEAEKFEALDSSGVRFVVKDKKGEVLGSIINSEISAKEVKGYGGEVPFIIGTGKDGKIIGVVLLENKESGGFVERIKKSGLLDSWDGLLPREAALKKVDAVTGATITSTAIIRSFQKTAGSFTAPDAIPAGRTIIKLLRFLIATITLLLGAIAFFNVGFFCRYRRTLITLNIIVLGFLTGYFLSLKFLFGCVMGVVPWRDLFIPLVILLSTIFMGLFTGRNLYCSCLCPYGSALEAAAAIRLKKIDISTRTYFILGKIRWCILMLVLFTLVLKWRIDLSYFEPFSFFSLGAAHFFVITMAIFFIALSVFIPRFWCRFVCPTGGILGLFCGKITGSRKDRSGSVGR
ncbi:MAG: FMN-binding protein [Candidatus Omnitrophica bacterium]|nr:FMN-binding protein [Candidatus Omnitrophota bacterium]